MTPKLDRLPEFDQRSRSFNVADVLTVKKPRSYTWSLNITLDQGTEGACVGHAWTHEAAARPVPRPVSQQMAFDVYYAARRLDIWPGEDYDGTSVLAGAKAMRERGLIRTYRWAFSLDDALAAISRHGPAVLGIDWFEGMFAPDRNGYIRPTGRVLGGHAILARGVNIKNRTVLLHNSWSPRWGRNGTALITWDDLGYLLDRQGECCVPVLR
jgi:hypothetical protein